MIAFVPDLDPTSLAWSTESFGLPDARIGVPDYDDRLATAPQRVRQGPSRRAARPMGSARPRP